MEEDRSKDAASRRLWTRGSEGFWLGWSRERRIGRMERQEDGIDGRIPGGIYGGQRVQIEWEICPKSYHSSSLLGCSLRAHTLPSLFLSSFFCPLSPAQELAYLSFGALRSKAAVCIWSCHRNVFRMMSSLSPAAFLAQCQCKPRMVSCSSGHWIFCFAYLLF